MSLLSSQPFHAASDAGGVARRGSSASSIVPSWLLKAKVTEAALPDGYLRRPRLLQRLDGLLERRLTVLRAPAGFGKTAVLADIALAAREQKRVVAWVSLDDDDTPDVFGDYLASALEHAGLDLSSFGAQESWSSAPAMHRIGMLARAVERHAEPCLLVLDEVDRPPRSTVQLIDLLLKRLPPNLHAAVAFRSDPGLELATHLLEGEAIVVDSQEFRFTKPEIARFFGGELSRRELAAVEEGTAGWPVALLFHRNLRDRARGGLGAEAAVLMDNYIGVRLLRDLSAEERAFLLDLAVFDWIEADLVDEVLGSSEARLRIMGLAPLDGLLLPVNGNDEAVRLHPMLREHCLDVLAVEDQARKGTLHRKIAQALVGRGHLTPAWRHAQATGDGRLLAELIERLGCFQLWLRAGAGQLVSAGRFLTPRVTDPYPRLELLRSVQLRLSSKIEEAHELFEAVAVRTDGFTRDRAGGDDEAMAVDGIFAQAIQSGCAPPATSTEQGCASSESRRMAENDERARSIASCRHIWLCIACHEHADFAESRRHGLQARKNLNEYSHHGDVIVDIYQGMSAMAQGRVQDAVESYRRARQGVRSFLPSDSCLSVSIDVLATELDLERDRARAIQKRTLKSLMELREVWVDIYTVAFAVSAELTLEQQDSEAVIQRLSAIVVDVGAKGIDNLSKNVSALLSNYLLEAGRLDEAERVWRDRELPCDLPELLDLDRQSWRTVELLSCARIRLLAERGDSVAAGELADGLCRTASERGLTRTLMRGLALSMVAAHRAGKRDRAQARLIEFLRLTHKVDFVRPLVRHRDVSRAVAQQLTGTDLPEDVRTAVGNILARLDEPAGASPDIFSMRELEVLSRVREGLHNSEIAVHLGVTDDGVRYHLKNIYRKTGVSSRAQAVRYAQSLGVLA